MDKKSMLKVTIIMIAALTVALLIRGFIVQYKNAQAVQPSLQEPPMEEMELQVKPYSGYIIVIDAGHGGADPGKVGVDGTLEKDINLEISMALKEALEEEGMTVVMTRQSDNGLYDENSSNKKMQDMRGRLAVIEESNADLVVSIHQNSFGDSSVCGPQVFYYETSEKGVEAAKLIQDALNTELEIARPRVQKGNDNYYLLTKCSKVMIIAECGFLSNPEEASLLNNKEYQERIVKAIRQGICEYLDSIERAPEDALEEKGILYDEVGEPVV